MSALHSAQITTFTTAYFLSAFIIFFTICRAVQVHLHYSPMLYVYNKYLYFYNNNNNSFFTTPARRFCFII